ncbi:MAG: thioredoxin family protein [Chloroflexota bacterium]
MNEIDSTWTWDDLARNNPGWLLVDFWGPRCAPCVRLKPVVEQLSAEMGVSLVGINAPQHRRLCIDRKVLSLPAFLLLRDGQEVARLCADVTAEQLREWLTGNLANAGSAGCIPSLNQTKETA